MILTLNIRIDNIDPKLHTIYNQITITNIFRSYYIVNLYF